MRFLVAIMVVAAPLAVASHSASPCEATVTTIDAGVETLYFVDDPSYGMWLYVEANDHAGLQRGGWYEEPFHASDAICWDREIATGEQIADPDFLVL